MTTKKLVQTAMMAALVLLSTLVFKIQTPVIGYIHLGDAFVIISGILLGPLSGGMAAGIGSALADFAGGYLIWCPGTLIIKFLVAYSAFHVYSGLTHFYSKEKYHPSQVIISGFAGELIMVIGYFLFNILVTIFSGGQISESAFSEAVVVSVAEIPFNVIQGTAGIIIASIFCPLFRKIVSFS